jgi:hypothetical protein
MQVRGRKEGEPSVAIYRFDGVKVPKGENGKATVQVRLSVERGGDLDAAAGNIASKASVEVVSRDGTSSGQIAIEPETNRINYVEVPVGCVDNGHFEVRIRSLTSGQDLGLEPDSVSLVSADVWFAWNLFKSLFILWMLSILIVVISVFCSTFVSWPIAVVLTLFILLGHWGVDELQDALDPGVGRSVAQDLGLSRKVIPSRLVESSVEGLASMLKFIAAFLPDASKFPATEDIERGINIPPAKMLGALGVVLGYGLPMMMLGYVILKNKEVAP